MKNSTQPLLDDLLPEELQPPMALDVFTKRIGVMAGPTGGLRVN